MRCELNRSPMTIKSYAEDFKSFESFLARLDGQLGWNGVDGDVIRDWMESMIDKGESARTVNRRLSAMRSLFKFALARHLVAQDPTTGIVGPKAKKPLPCFLKESEMDTLLDDSRWDNTYSSARARAIIMTFYETGMRRAELIALDDSDVDFASGQVKVTGKGDKQRYIPFGGELAQELRLYMSRRNHNVGHGDGALFLSDKGLRMTPNQVWHDVRTNLARVSTMKKLSPHVLRHTFATVMLNHGASIESVRRLLGHESVSTTEIYTHTTFEQLKRVYKDAHPRA